MTTEKDQKTVPALTEGTHQQAVKGYELEGLIVASTYGLSFLGNLSMFSFFAGIFVWLFALASPMILFSVSICAGLLYWFIDSTLGDFKSSGISNRMQMVKMSKRVRAVELSLAQYSK